MPLNLPSSDLNALIEIEEFHYKKDGGAALIPGVGVDLEKFYPLKEDEVHERDTLRKDLGIPEHAFHIVSAGEINKNKNYCNCNTMFAGIYIYLRSDQYCKLSQHFL